ncbi:TonB-dependent receptor plug domain-containing protein [Rheinheimera sp. UJ63]|uniref:TonB-dependent receptor plug domain-containing protein n=1 Tax=Rheinheimera sp. UJ63 TaxID=2910157 RepID=UPI001F1E168B|nr:TonB-dependent receptor [Rheinheimera sp. UJ63]MCF4010138.1 TonB-dependent receptor [Rheinheimera sp. UJ63]
MTMFNKITRAIRIALPVTASATFLSISFNHAAYADESVVAAAMQSAPIEKLIVTGVRGAPRTVADSPVPIDVFSEEDLSGVAFTDTNDVLKTLVPSYSLSRQPISDGGTFVRPASLRGLPTDKTLVLVNSKRRHRSAVVSTGGSGTQGPDIATIPVSALKGVEVLRDGAAAQYGSDAIAGVINFRLKDNSEGGSLSVDYGQYFEGDGESITVAGNIGFSLGDKGFFSLSAELANADATSRSEQYCESYFCLDTDNPVFNPNASYAQYLNDPAFLAGVAAANEAGLGVVQPWGQPESEATRIFFNSGYDINDDTKIYAFGNYSKSEATGVFFYRYPGNGTIENLREEDGTIYSPLEKFPGGFTPRFTGEVYDYSFTTGLEGMLANDISYDVTARMGHSEIQYSLNNTINPSLGSASPTSFKPGDLINEEFQLQADFVKDFTISGLDSPLVLAFGASYLDESYEIVAAADESSYSQGPYALPDPWGFCGIGSWTGTAASAVNLANAIANGLDCNNSADPVYRTVGVGSNGFPGYAPANSSKYTRDSYGVYVDVSSHVTEALFLQGALRFEDYSDFGSELVWKGAFKYDLTDTYAVRGSIGTGFRAPTPGQQGTTNVSTRLPNGFPVATGLFPASSAIAQALGAEELKPELSTNYTLGVTANYGSFTLTTDFYRIELQDLFYSISTMNVSSVAGASGYDNYLKLLGAGLPEADARNIGGVYYFQNAFDSITTGVDIVGNYSLPWDGGLTTLTGSFNYNKTEFDSDPSQYLTSAEDRYDYERGTPRVRGVFSAKHTVADLTILARANYYGSYYNSDASGGVIYAVQKFDPEWFFDLELSYPITDIVTMAVGARNIFDNYPQKSEYDACCGRVYSSATVVDWQGGYYYMRFSATF